MEVGALSVLAENDQRLHRAFVREYRVGHHRGELNRLAGLNEDLPVAHTVQADLDSSWPELGTIDVIWASASLHEFSHPEDVLRNALLALAPGGVIGIVEMDTPPLFLPDDLGLGAPGLETRIHDALSDQQSGWYHPEWSDGLAAAGFASLEKRTFTIDVPPERLKPVGRYADIYLRRLHPRLEGKLSAEDLAALDTLLSGDDPRSLNRRNDLYFRGVRTAWTGRRPEPV